MTGHFFSKHNILTRSSPSFQSNSLSTYLAYISFFCLWRFYGRQSQKLYWSQDQEPPAQSSQCRKLSDSSDVISPSYIHVDCTFFFFICLEMPSSRRICSMSFSGWPAFSFLSYPHLELRCFFKYVSLLEDRYCSSNMRDSAVLVKTLWV